MLFTSAQSTQTHCRNLLKKETAMQSRMRLNSIFNAPMYNVIEKDLFIM